MATGTGDSRPQQHKHPSLYFPTGDFVLSAPLPDTQSGRQLFRVHRFMLAHNSPVFAGMFSVPQVQGEGETYEGAPIAYVQDSAKDFADLLNALYNSTVLPFKRLDPNTPYLIIGILRLATKFEMEAWCARILDHFTADWPKTLGEWDRLEAEIKIATEQSSALVKPQLEHSPDLHFPEPVSAIHLAREFNRFEVLPAAFYSLARTPATRDWDMCHNDPQQYHDCLTARWGLLPARDLLRVVRAREVFQDNIDTLVQDYLGADMDDELEESCSYRDQCLNVRHWLVEKLHSDGLQHDPLRLMKMLQETTEARDSSGSVTATLCERCTSHIQRCMSAHRQNLWAFLRRTFDLPTSS